jgi:hypothetical protein
VTAQHGLQVLVQDEGLSWRLLNGAKGDAALSQPVIVTRNGRDRTVMISAEEYLRLKRRDRQVFAAGELPEEIIEAVRNSEMAADLHKDWTP